jgi:GTP pyrophosphokinase
MQRPITDPKNSDSQTAAILYEPIFNLLTKDIQVIEHQVIETALRFVAKNAALNGTGIFQTAIDHNIKTAQLVAELELDGYYRAASLLLTFLTTYYPDFLNTQHRDTFHPRLRRLLTKLTEINAYTQGQDYQANFNLESEQGYETIRNNLLKIVCQEEQTILLEIASQTTKLQDITKMPPEQQQMLALACMNIYAPLADKLGVWRLKWELEDFSFRYLQPKIYTQLWDQLDATYAERSQRIQEAILQLTYELEEKGIPCQVTGRPKHLFSIYCKMQNKGAGFEQIYDKYGLRVVIFTGKNKSRATQQSERDLTIAEARALCYKALEFVHEKWNHIPEEFDDYIQFPKPNGYQSLHTIIIDELDNPLEIQIRTDVMNLEAERGIAAHWVYKKRRANSHRF